MVKNWQLKRDMAYPYEEARPKRQWAIVFDLNKCIACQTCTLACKTTWTSGKGQEYMFWNNVETKPFGSYPLGWDVNVLEKLGQQDWAKNGTYQGKTIFEAAAPEERAVHFNPTDEDWMYPNHGEDDCVGQQNTGGHVSSLPHDKWFFYLPAPARIAPTRRASRRARARPSTSARKTASCSSTSHGAKATASACGPARTRNRCTTHTHASRKSVSAATRRWSRAFSPSAS